MNTNYTLTGNIPNKIKSNFLKNYLHQSFKKILFRKLNNIHFGQLTIVDNDTIYEFGTNRKNELNIKMEVLDIKAYSSIVLGGELGAAKEFINGSWKCDDLTALFRLFVRNKSALNSLNKIQSIFKIPLKTLDNFLTKNTVKGSKKNIEAHYDLSNDFYKLFLDDTMNYSSGIFLSNESSMRDASIEKMDRLCKKLDLKEGDKLLEIGSGWGGMALHAAKNYGCNVTTTTISKEQCKYVNDLIKKEKMESKITLLYKDYRKLTGKYDKIVSIEMIEAVGHDYIPEYFEKCNDLLKDNGIMAIQGINMNEQSYSEYLTSVDFIQKYIFPGASLISISHVLNSVRKNTKLNLVHFEDITPHYADTLRKWYNDFNSNLDKVKKLGFDKKFINMWEFYLCSCEAIFRERNIGSLQMTFAKSLNRRDPILGKLN